MSENFYTLVGSGDFFDPDNWGLTQGPTVGSPPAGPPGPSDGAIINSGSATAGQAVTLADLSLGSATLNADGNVSVANTIFLAGTANLTITNGSLFGGQLQVGSGSNAEISGDVILNSTNSSLVIGSGALTIAGALTLNNGNADSTLSKSTLDVQGDFALGGVPTNVTFGSELELNQQSTVTTEGNVTLGDAGFAILHIQSGSTFDASASDVIAGNQKNSQAQILVQNLNSLFEAATLTLGALGTATFTVQTKGNAEISGLMTIGASGTLNVSSTFFADQGFDVDGTANVFSTGSLTVGDGDVTIADAGRGSVFVQGIFDAAHSHVTLGAQDGGNGLLVVDQASATFTSDDLTVGGGGDGTFNVNTQGQATVQGDMTVGENATGSGTVDVSTQAQVTVQGDMKVGGDGSTVTVAGASLSVDGDSGLDIADTDGSADVVVTTDDNGDDGKLTVTGPIHVGSVGFGTLTVDAGDTGTFGQAVVNAGTMAIGGASDAGGTGYVHVTNDGEVQLTGAGASDTSVLVLDNPTLAVDGVGADMKGEVELTLDSTATLWSGETVSIDGIQSNPESPDGQSGLSTANGEWTINVVDSTHISLVGSSLSFDDGGQTVTPTYLGGGTVTPTAVAIDNGGFMDVGGSSDPNLGEAMQIEAGAKVSGQGVIVTSNSNSLDGLGSIVNNGGVSGGFEATGGTLAIMADVSGNGSASIDDQATLELGGSFEGTVFFNGGSGTTLKLEDPTHFTGMIATLAVGDTIDLAASSLPTTVVQTQIVGTTLDVTFSDDTQWQFQLDGSYAGDTFIISDLANGDTGLNLDQAPCYCRGTLIEIARGRQQRVETLNIGDKVRTASGALRPIRWIGQRSYAGRFVRGRKDILPVCIKAGALADNLPERDLWISPNHAMYFNGVLIEAKDLINGVSIVQAAQVESVEYFHIELETHDVIIAEGALAETFIDDDSRGMFHNAHDYETLYEDDRPGPAHYCAPRLNEGYEVEAVRRRLAQRAGLPRASDGERVGALRGYADLVTETCIVGWAQNIDAPEAPVCLDVLIRGRLIGQVLANAYRQDLARAGLGGGRHAFMFTAPDGMIFSPDAVEVRRSLDGALLTCSNVPRALHRRHTTSRERPIPAIQIKVHRKVARV